MTPENAAEAVAIPNQHESTEMSIHPINDLAKETMECPLCLGRGQLKRAEVLERLGAKDLARVAQLSAEEAFRLLLKRREEEQDALWLKFEGDLANRIREIEEKHHQELLIIGAERNALEQKLHTINDNHEVSLTNAREAERLAAEKQFRAEMSSLEGRIHDLEALQTVADQEKALELEKLRLGFDRTIADYVSQNTTLNNKNHDLELQLSKSSRIGKKEETDFEEEARTWPGIWIERVPRYGDYILAYRNPAGDPLNPRMVVDNKDKERVSEADIEKLIRDAREQNTPVAILVVREESQLRQLDRDNRWSSRDGCWILRTARQWIPRDLELLRPILDRMRTEGPDFLQKNAALSDEIRRTLTDLDEIEKELKKATKSIDTVKTMVIAYKDRLVQLCGSVRTAAPQN